MSVCWQCGGPLVFKQTRDVDRKRFCSRSCRSSYVSRVTTPQRAAKLRARSLGHRTRSGPYVELMTEAGYRAEHRVVVENELGRKLEWWEHVHHVNGDKADNRLENLEVLTVNEHTRLHRPWEYRWGKAVTA